MTPPDSLRLDNPLWQFALRLWNDDAIADVCLSLQSEGWSVTRILTAAWLAANGVRWDGREPDGLPEWRHQVTEPLRSLRQRLPRDHEGIAPMRHDIKSAELSSERTELAWIHAWHDRECHNLLNCPVDNPALLTRNLRAAAPGQRNTEETLMIQLTDALLCSGKQRRDTDAQGGTT
ncbi:TIGR02444 family protein [Tamilnaduibacter salinus]|uniref:TIGR02444 family protein n=1 Tax=Tamilnaduibacter salinus TaxID=1484056 RepID=A0A2A2HZ02_9GAMM|nr:TIGR02444 family protein [Tamilnaduibacter salinus]PAV24539.1 TIGR02444 family protein [Tamilnaduibacter salinus]